MDRRSNSKFLLIVIAGYKSFLYEDVFNRLENFVPKNIDVCVASAGLFDDKLFAITAKNNWSYLTIERNCVALLQNFVMLLHPQAEIIYKMDEDIFVTKNCFEVLLNTFNKALRDGLYDVGFVAPLIPINGYGHVRILEKLGLTEMYNEKFEKVKYASYSSRMIEKNPEVAKFFWGEGGFVPSIDVMNMAFQIQKLSYRACPIRFSIGFIMFHRRVWELLGGWAVPKKGVGLGGDESQICRFCIECSQAIIVSENTVVGHLSFGQQNEAMKSYYLDHRNIFSLH